MKLLQRLRGWLGLAPPPPIPAERWQAAEAALPFLDWLDEDQRQRLRTLAAAFLREKQFYGAHGLELDEPMLLSIALQACLPVLNQGLAAYRGWVGVIVYPGAFVVPRAEMDEDGVVHEYDDTVAGEAWEGGPVLLSWELGDTHHDGAFNVVIHEFAHKLDMVNGEVDGLPRLPPGMSAEAWAEAFGEAYEALWDDLEADREPPIDPYAAENPGEFFAVCSEYFFTAPLHLREVYPAVYQQLAGYYGMDPAARAGAEKTTRAAETEDA